MKIYSIDSPCIVLDLKEHSVIKSKLLNLIDELPLTSFNDDGQRISKTDWNLPKEHKRDYLDLFYNTINPYMDNLSSQMFSKGWNITNAWFQQYYNLDHHSWHNHIDVNYTCVYYLELPNLSEKTEIFNISTKKFVEIEEVKEGSIIIFPACIPHRSKPIKSNHRKTVIAFNLNFVDIDNSKINDCSNG
jgi:hypothetical protein